MIASKHTIPTGLVGITMHKIYPVYNHICYFCKSHYAPAVAKDGKFYCSAICYMRGVSKSLTRLKFNDYHLVNYARGNKGNSAK